jgi:selenocysteine lyase/cysteine desulfurase
MMLPQLDVTWYSASMTTSISILPNQRALFDIPDHVTYLNCAYMSPLMNSVAAAGEAAVRQKQHPWEISAAEFFDVPLKGRELFARLVGADADDIAIVPAVSYGMAIAALNTGIRPDEEILILEDQFPSNVYPWKEKARDCGARLVVIPRVSPSGEDPRATRRSVDAGASAATSARRHSLTSRIIKAISDRTAVVALPQCHWIDGTLIDLVAVGKAVRKAGAKLVLDLTQSVGALPVDVREIRPDYLVCASYKWLFGPYSIGFLYVAPHLQQGRPLEYGWTDRKGSMDFSRLVDYQDEFVSGAVRFDMGQRSQLQLMPMAIRGMQQLLDWGVPEIAATLSQKNRDIAERARKLGLTCVPEDQRAGHYLGLGFPDGMPVDIHRKLARNDIHVSIRGDSMRITPHLYNTDEDSDRLIEILGSLL